MSAHAQSTEAGDRLSYSRSSESSPEEWAEFQRAAEEFYMSRYTSEAEQAEHLEAGSRFFCHNCKSSREAGSRCEELGHRVVIDRDARRSSTSEEIRSRELEELEQHRNAITHYQSRPVAIDSNNSSTSESSGTRGVVRVDSSSELRDHRGRRIAPRAHEPAASEELSTYEITIGLGEELEVLELAQRISSRLGEYGFRISEEIGSWSGELERCARIVFQGPEERARVILEVIAEELPEEELAHIAISTPRVMYEPIALYRPADHSEHSERARVLASVGLLREISEVMS